MPGVSIVWAAAVPRLSATFFRKPSRCELSCARSNPGLVQNWPAPIVSDATKFLAICSPRDASAAGRTSTGLMLLISAYTGIGSGRAFAIFISASPPPREPVKPTALMRGSATSAPPSQLPAP